MVAKFTPKIMWRLRVMKKYLALLLALCMIFVLCACGAEEAVEEVASETGEAAEGYVMLSEPISTEQYGIAFKQGNEELRDAVLAGVYKLFADGTMQEIAAKPDYNLADMICLDEKDAVEFDMDAASEEMKARTTLTVGFDAEYPPYGYKDEKTGEYTGFDLEMAEEVCKMYGWELKKQPIDWDSKDMELNSGSIDCIWNGMTMTGRESEYTWSDAYIDNSIVVLTRADTGIESLEDLEGKTVVTQAGSSALTALTDEDARADLAETFESLEQTPDYNSAMLGLDSGLYDAVAIDIGVAMYYLNGGSAK